MTNLDNINSTWEQLKTMCSTDNLVYSSRSRLEAFLDCPRLGYIRYLWDGRGLSKRAASVYLSTGTYIHIGLEYIFRLFSTGELDEGDLPSPTAPNAPVYQHHVDVACTKSLAAYVNEIRDRGFDLEEGEDKANEQFVVSEQCALVEAFIRSFASRVLPDLLNRFKIVDVEREEQVTFGNLVVEGRIDVTLEERSTADIYITSFKTAAQWDRRQEKANEHDNQGLSETFILESRLREENEDLRKLLAGLEATVRYKNLPDAVIKASNKYNGYIQRFMKSEKVMGVVMIYLLKGKRYESSSRPGLWEQHSPLVRAYRKLIGTEYEYAASLWYDNPANKSGKGRLGKGWEPFNVWECEEVGFIRGWVAKLADPSNSLGQDVIGNSFKIPAPYFRNQEHIDSWVRQAKAIEQEVQSKQKLLNSLIHGMELSKSLDFYFPQRRKGCHYPVDCEMLDVCYNRSVFDDPIGSGKFVYRKPHHKLEKEAQQRLYGISEAQRQESRQSEHGNNSQREINRIVETVSSPPSNNQGAMGNNTEIGVLDEEIIIDV